MSEPLLTVIAARGGSRGLPGKNARPLGDLPLFAWSYLAWREASLPGLCWLSTDDEELAQMGRGLGLDVPFLRPSELATDDATALDVALHALDHHREIFGSDPEWYLLLQPTSPLRPPGLLLEAWQRAQADPADAILGVKTLYRSLATLYRSDDRGALTPLEKTPAESRRQDVAPLLTPNGALYLVRSAVLRRDRTFVPERTLAMPMDAIVSIDIDDATDWMLAEAVVTHGGSWRGVGRERVR